MTASGYTDARPLQVRVADEIRARIESAEYAPGQQLPTLDDLAQTYGCSLAVIRKSLDLLRQQGLVVTVQGKGSFVRERPTARRHGIERYSRSTWKNGKPILTAEADMQGHKASQVIRELAEVPAPAVVAEKFGVPAGTPVWVRRRTTLINDRPNQLADSYYELKVVEGTLIQEENTGPGGGFARLEDAGYLLDRISEEWTVRMPTGPETVALRLPAGTPVVNLVRTTFDTTGMAVEVMLATLAGDMVSFAYDFPIPD
ncbi:GntR family transcriptional regulator [Catellatospora citrea]|uniref:GntR family transcriptional regulator n=2 Tax=Catellatospora citrea TaxID=53366 RepID=UPI000E748759|nr:GntR family transcriptional regulator [Catellatospora citrea]RKE09692.1 GntR family transcriptional regulator [Catellatospora citrea]